MWCESVGEKNLGVHFLVCVKIDEGIGGSETNRD